MRKVVRQISSLSIVVSSVVSTVAITTFLHHKLYENHAFNKVK